MLRLAPRGGYTPRDIETSSWSTWRGLFFFSIAWRFNMGGYYIICLYRERCIMSDFPFEPAITTDNLSSPFYCLYYLPSPPSHLFLPAKTERQISPSEVKRHHRLSLGAYQTPSTPTLNKRLLNHQQHLYVKNILDSIPYTTTTTTTPPLHPSEIVRFDCITEFPSFVFPLLSTCMRSEAAFRAVVCDLHR